VAKIIPFSIYEMADIKDHVPPGRDFRIGLVEVVDMIFVYPVHQLILVRKMAVKGSARNSALVDYVLHRCFSKDFLSRIFSSDVARISSVSGFMNTVKSSTITQENNHSFCHTGNQKAYFVTWHLTERYNNYRNPFKGW
jgi:hypothetical protein